MRVERKEAQKLARQLRWLQQQYFQSQCYPSLEKEAENKLKECFYALTQYENITIKYGKLGNFIVLFDGEPLDLSGVRFPL